MLRIGAMNMALHGIEGANVAYRDSLAEDHAEDAGRYSLVLANPPFAGALDTDVDREGFAAHRQDQEDRTYCSSRCSCGC